MNTENSGSFTNPAIERTEPDTPVNTQPTLQVTSINHSDLFTEEDCVNLNLFSFGLEKKDYKSLYRLHNGGPSWSRQYDTMYIKANPKKNNLLYCLKLFLLHEYCDRQ